MPASAEAIAFSRKICVHPVDSRVLYVQVTVDSQGLIKVAHMGIAGGGGTAMPPRFNEAASTQGGRNWVQFMMLPEDASIEEDDERPD